MINWKKESAGIWGDELRKTDASENEQDDEREDDEWERKDSQMLPGMKRTFSVIRLSSTASGIWRSAVRLGPLTE